MHRCELGLRWQLPWRKRIGGFSSALKKANIRNMETVITGFLKRKKKKSIHYVAGPLLEYVESLTSSKYEKLEF